jgi:nitrite reductase (NADH) small subunit
MNWIRITETRNIPEREGRTVELGPTSVALFNLGERFVAIENRCPHKGGPLADGIVGGTMVTCPLHNWRICLESGEVRKGCNGQDIRLRTFDVKVEDGTVMLSLEKRQEPVSFQAESNAA